MKQRSTAFADSQTRSTPARFTCLFHLPAPFLCLGLLRSALISYNGSTIFRTCLHALTADRSTTELRWITQLKKTGVGIFAHDWLKATANALIGLQIDANGAAATIF